MNSVNTQTRRKSARTKVASSEIVYLHFPTANGAVALDVSAEGIGFQAASPLQANEVLPFRLSVPGFPEVALSGEIIWLDSTRKRGGMRLTVPPESVALFEKWQRKYLDSTIEADEIPVSANRNRAPAPASPFASEVRHKTEYRPPAKAAAETHETAPAADSAPAPHESPRAAPPPVNTFARRADSLLGTRGPIFVSEWEVPPETSRTGRNILVALVIVGICAVIAGGSYYLTGKRAVGNMLINLGQQIGGSGTSPSAGAAAPPAVSGSQGAAGAVASGGTASSTGTPAQSTAAPSAGAVASPATNPSTPQTPAATLPPQSQPANPTSTPEAAAPPAAPQKNPDGSSADSQNSAGTAPQNATQSGSADAAAAPPPDAKTQSKSHPASASAQPSQLAAASGDDGGADLREALTYLQSPNPQDAAVAEDLLWSAIGAGSTQADLVLGDLYMRGQGAVHRNCRQAEVLLHAALVADVPGANEKVDELQTYGCR